MQQKHSTQQSQTYAVSPKQIQLFSLLQTPVALLAQRIKEEVEKNIFLEADSISSHEESPSISNEEEDISPQSDYDYDSTEQYHTQGEKHLQALYDRRILALRDRQTARDNLQEQLIGLPLDKHIQKIAIFIIESLDDTGLLTKTPHTLRYDLLVKYDLDVDEREFKAALKVVQSLEPAGIAARNVAESLHLQLLRVHPIPHIALNIITNHYEDFLHNRKECLQNLPYTDEEIQQSLTLIRSLHPYPFLSEETMERRTLQPDFIIHNEQGQLRVESTHYEGLYPSISAYYTRMLARYTGILNQAEKDAYQFLKEKKQQAEFFLENLKTRARLLTMVMQLIVEKQQQFFKTGDFTTLQPMILKDIALPLEVDISTMSRMIYEKYAQTEFGIFPLKKFFLRSVTNKEGEPMHQHLIREQLRTLIESEDVTNPYTDEQLQELLAIHYHIPIARRTIAKYRTSMGIVASDERKKKTENQLS